MKTVTVELFSEAVNAAVVRLPGRAFPGMVIQGDTLHTLLRDIQELQQIADPLSNSDLSAAIDALVVEFRQRVKTYEDTLRLEGVALPY